jgi:hypothetical protein
VRDDVGVRAQCEFVRAVARGMRDAGFALVARAAATKASARSLQDDLDVVSALRDPLRNERGGLIGRCDDGL